jgi:predicted lipoprotein with Yx(FWY)xxD motif
MNMRLAVVGALATAVALLGACSPGRSPTATPGASASATRGAASPSPGAPGTLSPAASPQPAVVIHTGTVLISEAPRAVLVDPQGFTLYYHTADTPTVVCSGACATTWPPVTDPSGTPTASPPLTGQLGVVENENGRQVTYNGHPLYHYSGDRGPGQANGQGVGKLWYVATPTLAAGH